MFNGIIISSSLLFCASSTRVPTPSDRVSSHVRLSIVTARGWKIHVQSAVSSMINYLQVWVNLKLVDLQGIYPAIMKILINWQRSLDSETLISTSLRTLSLDVQPISSRQTTDHTRTKSYRSFSGTRARIRTTRRAWAEMSVQTEGDGQIPL